MKYFWISSSIALGIIFSTLISSSVGASRTNQIDDAVFYNFTSMSEANINNFIAAFPNSCLVPKNYPSGLSPITFSEPQNYNNYGGAVSPARIIWNASQFYKINPQVLLATLEKEQNLVSGNGGCGVWRYNSAMGYNCPDGSENALKDYPNINIYRTCVAKESNAGFSRQVNHGAWQLSFDGKRANGELSWMGDGGTTYYGRMTQGNRARVNGGAVTYYDGYTVIGGQSIYLENGATAALYNYTPHFSNFENIFIGWFGSVRAGASTAQKFSARWLELGGDVGKLGKPLENEKCGLRESGCFQKFQGGYMMWTATTGAWETIGHIRDRWMQLGGEWGQLGYPVEGEKCGTVGGGCYQKYQGGYMIWSQQTGAWESIGAIRDRWMQLGGEWGQLGYPVENIVCGTKNNGCYQKFQGGYILLSQQTGAWESIGAIRDRWMQLGGEWGQLGYPVEGEVCVRSDNSQCTQKFENGTTLKWTKQGGVTIQ